MGIDVGGMRVIGRSEKVGSRAASSIKTQDRRHSRVRTHLIAKTLGGNDGDFIAYPLVCLEIESEFGVVPLDDDFGRLLDGLSRKEN